MVVRVTSSYAKAKRLFNTDLNEAVKLLEAEPKESPSYGLALSDLALAHRIRGDLDEAIRYATLANEHFEGNGCPHPASWVQAHRMLCESYATREEIHNAGQAFRATSARFDELMKDANQDDEIELQAQFANSKAAFGMSLLDFNRTDEGFELLREADETLERLGSDFTSWRSVALTNLGHAYQDKGNLYSASAAFQEAQKLAEQSDTPDQAQRAAVALLQLDPNAVLPELREELLKKSIAKALDDGDMNTAYTRVCISLHVHGVLKDREGVIADLAQLVRIESKIDPTHSYRAKSKRIEAEALVNCGDPPDSVLAQFAESCQRSYERIRLDLTNADFKALATDLHDTFRLYSSTLLSLDRTREAVVAFEGGRALAHCAQTFGVDAARAIIDRIAIDRSGTIDTALLDEVCSLLGPTDVWVSMAILPPNLVGFVIGKTDLEVVRAELPNGRKAAEAMLESLSALPAGLSEGKGLDAIEESITKGASEIAARIGDRCVRRIMPYGPLHSVPWRELLRQSDVPRTQLQCTTDFGLLPALEHAKGTATSVDTCIALGNGTTQDAAGKVYDLVEEAVEFAKQYGDKGNAVKDCTAEQLSHALQSQAVVLVSCHGENIGGRIFLKLAGGNASVDEFAGQQVRAPLVVLSACWSGAYRVAWGGYPVGLAPALVQKGAGSVICFRYPVGSVFAKDLLLEFASRLVSGASPSEALSKALATREAAGDDPWLDLGCVELLGRA